MSILLRRFLFLFFLFFFAPLGLIGDPSGRETERSMLDQQEAIENCVKVGADALNVLKKACDPNGPAPILMNNSDWYASMSSMEMLRDVGRHFRVPTMLRRESVRFVLIPR